MIDIFDIINDRRDRRINIQGIVSELDTSPYTIYELNDLINLLLNNRNEIDTTKLDVKQDVSFMPRSPLSRGMYGSGYERIEELRIESIIFEIDVHMNAQLYNEIYNKHEGFIDYFTVGAFGYDVQDELMITTDFEEEYMSARIVPDPEPVSSTIIWDEISSMDEYIGNRLFDIGGRPVIRYRSHDADGDAVFAAEFRPTDFSGMFRNCNNFDLSRLD